MIQNLFKIALRLLWRDRFFSLLNISGLALGLTAAIFMFLWVHDELTFDQFHSRKDRIYRVVTNWQFGEEREWTSSIPAPLKDEAMAATPGIEHMVRTFNLGEETFQVGPNKASIEKVILAENGFLEIFDFPFLVGSAQTALDEPGNVVLTEAAAIKIFGTIPPLGATVRHPDKGEYVVGGILKNLPTNSSLDFDAIMPWESNILKFIRNPKYAFNWGQINFGCWVQLRPDADAAAVASNFSAISSKFRDADSGFYFALQNVQDIHLYSDFLRWKNDNGSLGAIRLVGLIGLIVLIIACINYVNLTTARAHGRAKSIGIRQTIGAGKGHLFAIAMGESALTILAAMALSAIMIWLALPAFEELGGKAFTRAQIFNPSTFLLFGITGLSAWLLSGMQPAFQLTRFKPVSAMKGQVSVGKGAWMRKSLVVGQFVFSIGLGICSMLVYKQLQFVQKRNLGYDREHTFMCFISDKALLLKNELTGKAGISSVALADNPFVNLGSQVSGDDWEGKAPDQPSDLWQINVCSEFPQQFNLELKEGRWFRPGDADTLSYVINESAAKMMQLESPVGKWMQHGGYRGTIVGVAKDFHFQSLHTAIEPMIFSQSPDWYFTIYVKSSGANVGQALASTQAAFQKFYPDKAFKYEFLDDQYDDLYKSEARIGSLTGLFTGLALFISCLGLFGLAAFAAVQRTKEIGIRKVLGASATGIAALLSKDFLLLIIIAFVIASPLAYHFMQAWLADFAYHIDIPWWIFALAACLAITIAILTVSIQSIKAALADPVKSLRSE